MVFVSLRGYLSQFYSDPGSQLVSASKEMKDVINGLDTSLVAQFGVTKVFSRNSVLEMVPDRMVVLKHL